jgi:hypothetical protein
MHLFKIRQYSTVYLFLKGTINATWSLQEGKFCQFKNTQSCTFSNKFFGSIAHSVFECSLSSGDLLILWPILWPNIIYSTTKCNVAYVIPGSAGGAELSPSLEAGMLGL